MRPGHNDLAFSQRCTTLFSRHVLRDRAGMSLLKRVTALTVSITGADFFVNPIVREGVSWPRNDPETTARSVAETLWRRGAV